MKRFHRILLAAMLIVAVTAPAALAWEFSMEGKWTWGVDYFTQAGNAGFSGRNNISPPAAVALFTPPFAGYNGWMGARTVNGTQYGFVVGNDAALNWSRLEFWPEIRINQAVRMRGLLEFGDQAWNRYGLYYNNHSYGWANGMAFGKLNQWWLTAQMPIGILVAGKRTAPFGMGIQYDGLNATSESLALIAPYGPLRIGVYCYPQRRASWFPAVSTIPGVANAAPTMLSSGIVASGLADAPLLGITGTAFGTYAHAWDKEQIRNIQPGIFFTYSSGDVEFGALYEFWTQHGTPAEALAQGLVQFVPTVDQNAQDGSIFFKYFNGRFFFNTELAYFGGQMNFTPPITTGVANVSAPIWPGDGSGSQYAPKYLDSWKLVVETGVISGPAKVSLLYSWVPGPDRRHGIWIDRMPWENIGAGGFLGSTQVYLPYSLLMGYQYGAGLNAINSRGEGFMTDASMLAARVDYSVAANLNVYGTFFYANRVSNGWGWGSLVPDGRTTGTTLSSGPRRMALLGGFAADNPPAYYINDYANPAPSIPDDALGWEITVGADWKLLEGMTLGMRGAYWNVGQWFNYACLDKSLATGNTTLVTTPGYLYGNAADGAVLGSGWGVNPNRAIDPIYGFQAVVTVDF